ncbi:MAG: hypothetical protein ACFBZ9_10170 [Sphingomonadales bacterium]
MDDDDFLETLKRKGWHGTPWQERRGKKPGQRRASISTNALFLLLSIGASASMLLFYMVLLR